MRHLSGTFTKDALPAQPQIPLIPSGHMATLPISRLVGNWPLPCTGNSPNNVLAGGLVYERVGRDSVQGNLLPKNLWVLILSSYRVSTKECQSKIDRRSGGGVAPPEDVSERR